MAYRIGTANGYLDALFAMYKFVSSANMISNIVYTGGNTGDGFLSAEWAGDDSAFVFDDWVITMTSATTFTVSGSSGGYGAQTNTGTVDEPYISDNGEVGFKVISGDTAWINGDTITFSTAEGVGELAKWQTNRYNMVYDDNISYNGVVNENVKGSIGNPNYDMYAPDENWTVTFTSATTFDVSGESGKSGAQASGTVGVAYDNGIVNFTILAGTTAFEVDDVITFTIPVWRELMLMAPGNAGTEEIYMGIKTHYAEPQAGDVYQWKLNGYTGFNAEADFINQPGSIVLEDSVNHGVPRICFQLRENEYWMCANGRRITMFVKCGSFYESMYLGFMLPYSLPTEGTYPMAVGGTTLNENHPFTNSSQEHSSWWNSLTVNNGNGATLWIWDGNSWSYFSNENEDGGYDNNMNGAHWGITWPYASPTYSDSLASEIQTVWSKMSKNSDGSYNCFPIIPVRYKPTRFIYGEFEGVFAVTGDAVNSEDISQIQVSSGVFETYVYFQNVSREDSRHYAALRLR